MQVLSTLLIMGFYKKQSKNGICAAADVTSCLSEGTRHRWWQNLPPAVRGVSYTLRLRKEPAHIQRKVVWPTWPPRRPPDFRGKLKGKSDFPGLGRGYCLAPDFRLSSLLCR